MIYFICGLLIAGFIAVLILGNWMFECFRIRNERKLQKRILPRPIPIRAVSPLHITCDSCGAIRQCVWIIDAGWVCESCRELK